MLKNIEKNPNHHITGSFPPASPTSMSPPSSPITTVGPGFHDSLGFWSDITSMRWMRIPSSSLKMIMYLILLYMNFALLQKLGIVSPTISNPFAALFFISHRVPSSSPDDPRYQKGYKDLLFVGFYIIVWSFVRQSLMLNILPPLARLGGITKRTKIDRFGEQGYAFLYFLCMSVYGLAVMSTSKIWWYRTEHFWIDLPHWEMTPLMKSYYLLHSAYWSQQFLVLVLGLEKPRKDYRELVIHHIVTLWLIGWSYLINMTQIGNAVYLTMDISDIFLALTKLMNYLKFEKSKVFVFIILVGTWTYFRHYLNLKMLYSVWYEFDLIPETSKRWTPKDGVWFPSWMKYQVFAPLMLLQLVNVFWLFLILRIAWRAVTSSKLDDERSDDEDGVEEEEEEKEVHLTRPQALQNGVSRRAGRTTVVKKEEDDD